MNFLKVEFLRGVSVFIVAVACYVNSTTGSFHYDDFHSIVENTSIRSLENLPRFFVDPELFSGDVGKGMYRPLLLITFALNYGIHGYEVAGYHFFNIVLHALTACLVWRLSVIVVACERSALIAAFLFAVHPLASEPVNYISSRSELLSVFLYIGAFLFHVNRSNRLAISWGAIGLYAFGLLSKSTVLTLPAALLLYEVAFNNRKESWSFLAIVHCPYWIVTALYGGILYATGFLGTSFGNLVRPLNVQVLTQVKAVVYYVKLLMFPAVLNVEHQFFVSYSFFEPSVIASCGVGVSFLALIFFCWKRRERLGAFLVMWAGMALVPSSIMPLNMLVNERRLYLVAAIASIGIGMLCRSIRAPGIIITVSLLAGVTLSRNFVWANDLTLWSDSVKKAPMMYRAQTNMGKALQEEGRWDSALVAYSKAIAIDSKQSDAYNNTAVIYQLRGDVDKAILLYHRAIKYSPYLDKTYQNLGDAYTRKGDLVSAVAMYEKSLELDDGDAGTWNNFGQTLLIDNRVDQAEAAFLKSIEINSALAEPYNNLGNVHSRKGNYEQAVAAYKDALIRLPDHPAVVLSNLADTYRLQGKLIKAKVEIDHSLKLDSTDARAHYYRGRIQRALGNVQMAVRAFESAVVLQPNYVLAMLEQAEIFSVEKPRVSIDILNKVLAIEVSNPRCLFILGDVLERIGETGKARLAYEQFLNVWNRDDQKRSDVELRLEELK